MLCLILLDSFVDVELERKGALLCMRLRLILFLSHCQMSLSVGGERVMIVGKISKIKLTFFCSVRSDRVLRL